MLEMWPISILVHGPDPSIPLTFTTIHAHLRTRHPRIRAQDSDLLVFGAPEVLFKMDGSGSVVRVRLARLGEIGVRAGKRTVTLRGWPHNLFRGMCILGGCDYLPRHDRASHIRGVGLVKALKAIALHKDLGRVVRKLAKSHEIPDGYEV